MAVELWKSLNYCCSFCENEIKGCALECIDSNNKFCDLCCAKLYYDNIEPINININLYIKHFRENDLEPLACNIYKRLGNKLFEMMPKYRFDKSISKIDAKTKYLNVYLH